MRGAGSIGAGRQGRMVFFGKLRRVGAAYLPAPEPRLQATAMQYSLRGRRFVCEGSLMPKRKPLTSAEQTEKFRFAAQKRIDSGLLSSDDADAAVDAMIRKNIKDHGA